jgi:hypothetical protein
LPTTQPSNKIIGNISSENILSHCWRGVPELFATTACKRLGWVVGS